MYLLVNISQDCVSLIIHFICLGILNWKEWRDKSDFLHKENLMELREWLIYWYVLLEATLIRKTFTEEHLYFIQPLQISRLLGKGINNFPGALIYMSAFHYL